LFAISKGKLVYEPGTKFTEFVDVGNTATIQANQNIPKNNFKRQFQNNRGGGNNRNPNNNNRFGGNNAGNAGNGAVRNNKFNRFKKKNNANNS
jgi:hypothetical protein